MPRVLVADPIAEAGLARLRAHADVDVELKQSPAALIARIPDYDALIVRSETRVDAAVIRGLPYKSPEQLPIKEMPRHDIAAFRFELNC